MPGQVLFQANPQPDPSLLPDSILEFSVKLDTKNYLPQDELKAVQKFRRAADYIAAGEHSLSVCAIVIDFRPCSYDLFERQCTFERQVDTR